MGFGVWGMKTDPDPDELEERRWETVLVFYPYLSGLLLGPLCLIVGWHLVAWLLTCIGFITVGKRFNGSIAHQGQLLANLLGMVISMCFIVWDRFNALLNSTQTAS